LSGFRAVCHRVEFDQAGNLLQREAGGLRRANEAKAFHICTAILADAT